MKDNIHEVRVRLNVSDPIDKAIWAALDKANPNGHARKVLYDHLCIGPAKKTSKTHLALAAPASLKHSPKTKVPKTEIAMEENAEGAVRGRMKNMLNSF
jgi:hypothetical protein